MQINIKARLLNFYVTFDRNVKIPTKISKTYLYTQNQSFHFATNAFVFMGFM